MTRRDKKIKLAAPFPVRLFADDKAFLDGGSYGDITEFVRNSVHMQILQVRGIYYTQLISSTEKTEEGRRSQGCRAGGADTRTCTWKHLPHLPAKKYPLLNPPEPASMNDDPD